MNNPGNKRKLFINNRLRNFFIFYTFFSLLIVILFLGWEFFIALFNDSLSCIPWMENLQGFPMLIKVILLLLWGMFSFLLSYTYLECKFLGIFTRMNDLFTSMITNENLKLTFRQGDPFCFVSDSFNDMRQKFLDRISKRKKLIEHLNTQIDQLSNVPGQEKIQNILEQIDQELAH